MWFKGTTSPHTIYNVFLIKKQLFFVVLRIRVQYFCHTKTVTRTNVFLGGSENV